VNSEELELSLKAEFESYLSGVFADMKQEVADFQAKIDGEFEKHRTQLDEAFKAFSAKFETERGVDKGFSESVGTIRAGGSEFVRIHPRVETAVKVAFADARAALLEERLRR